jgi:hypothetical protein
MARFPIRQRPVLARVRLRFGAFALLLCACLAVDLHSQSSLAAPDPAETSRIAGLSDGTISGNTYHNAELGFRYQFPDGWIVNDKATQQKAIADGYQFVWGEDTSAKRSRKAARQCTKDLLFVTRYPEGMRVNGFNPMAFLIAADPKCAPSITFPSTVNDHEAIQRITSQLGIYFKTSTISARSPTRIRAFDNGGRVMLETSQSFSISTHQPGRDTFQNIRSSVLTMKAGEYWVMWMFASDDDVQLDKLRASKIFFDAAPAEPAETKKPDH